MWNDEIPLPSWLARLVSLVDAHPVPAVIVAVVALTLLVLAFFALRASMRAAGRHLRTGALHARDWAAGRSAEDILTIVAASIATAVSAQGMWRFFGDVLNFGGPLRLLLFAFLEVAVVTSAVRARRSMREKYAAGLDGLAVWALTCLSAVLSAMDARSLAEAMFRLAAPLVAAWLWERGMAIERQRITGRRRIHWRLTPERVLVRLRLAETTDRTAGEVDTRRRLTRVALAAKKARDLREAGASSRKQTKALNQMQRAFTAAYAHTGLGRDETRQRELLGEVAVLYDAPGLLDVAPASAWTRPTTGQDPQEPSDITQLAEETRHLARVILDRQNGESLPAVVERQDREHLAALATLAAAATRQHLWPVTPGVTPSATTPATPLPVTFDITNPSVFDPRQAFTHPANVPPPVTSTVTPNVTGNGVANKGEEATKTKVMRAFWDRERAQGRYPTVTELAAHAGAHHSLASKLRPIWVEELRGWEKRRANRATKREKATA